MPILLFAMFLKGPVWLRGLVLLCFGGLLLFACLSTANIFRNAVERPVPVHANHARKH